MAMSVPLLWKTVQNPFPKLSSNPTTGYISKGTESSTSKDTCLPLFMARDFEIVKTNKQTKNTVNFKCSLTDEWVKKI